MRYLCTNKEFAMNISLSLNDIYSMLAGLSVDNKKWLTEKLINDVAGSSRKPRVLEFPHVRDGRQVSREVLDMVVGTLPKGFDVEKETDNMWEELAR